MKIVIPLFGINKYVFIVLTLLFNVGGGYFAKLSSLSHGFPDYKYLALSIFCYGSGFLVYIAALKFIPLFVVQSLLSSQYVLMVMLSYFVFEENISLHQGLGMLLIGVGLVLVVGRS